MNTKIEMKQEDPLKDDIASQKQVEFFPKDASVKPKSDAVFLNNNCDVAIKTEVKSETFFPNFSSQRECYTKQPNNPSKSRTVICSNNYVREVTMKNEVQTQISQNEKEFLPEDSVMSNKYNSIHEMDSKIEIKEEPWLLETEASSVCDHIKDGEFPSVESRLCMESESANGTSKQHLSEVLGGGTNFYCIKNNAEYESNAIKVPDVEHFHSEQSGKSSHGGEMCSKTLYLKQKDKRHRCIICEKRFTRLSDLKRHDLIHTGKKPHHCDTCNKRFTWLSHLKTHNLIHEGKKPFQCNTCNKSFTRLSHLKIHNLTHEGIKPHQCESCYRSFTQLSDLKRHNLIHEGKKPHKCDTCDKSFTQLTSLKLHNWIHEGKKPHHCKTCNKSFTRLSSLKMHHLIHEGKKSHQCKICIKNFTRLSDLKRHILIHLPNSHISVTI